MGARALGRQASDFPPESVVKHLQAQHENHHAEDEAERFGVGFDQNAAAQQRAGQDSQHNGHGEAGIDVSAAEVNSGAGGGGYADHEIAGGGGNFKGDAHGLI